MKPQEVARAFEVAEQDVGQARPRHLTAEGEAALDAAKPEIEVVDRPVDNEWAEMMKFAKDILTIVVNPSADKNAEDPVFCANSGDPMWLHRNKEYKIERRFVESLARAKITTYTQKEETAPNGVRHIVNVPHTACRYPFRVVHDPHPRGGEWLKHILLEP